MLKFRNKREFQTIFDEIIFLDPQLADELMRFVFREPHDFLCCDVEKSLFFRNFDRVSIEESKET